MIRLLRWYWNGDPAPTIYELDDLAEARIYAAAFAADQLGVDAPEAAAFAELVTTVGFRVVSARGFAVRAEYEPVCTCGHYEFEHVPMVGGPHDGEAACFHRVDHDPEPADDPDQKWCGCEKYEAA